MTDISVSERRLSAALDRIDQFLEAGPAARTDRAAPSADIGLQTRLDAALAENRRLQDELAARDTVSDEGGDRLASASEQAARLAAANDDLAAANRVLIEAASGQGDLAEAVSVALEAEIEALRAARAAEIAQLGDIMVELERLLAGEGEGQAAGDATAEAAADSGGVPDLSEAADNDDLQSEDR
ncbi:hypothetical protein JJJ17_06300 [Paracoccus caeni]|uniref:Uncharacterized protein n=1 Tax=Paracoccus caeni TaxID=657651 RepID=A0A934SJE5_9RHOB|nr:hypothetical protein [Paracoccus caeni]MBK4215533.1 hypothetical protein [Paracoccus caeni]